MDHCSFYLPDPSTISNKTLLAVEGVTGFKARKNERGRAVGIELQTQFGPISMNFMNPKEIPEHLEGFVGWVHHCAESDPHVKVDVVSQVILQTNFCIGCNIRHGFDDDFFILSMVVDIAAALKGFAFINDTIVAGDGDFLCGRMKMELEEVLGPLDEDQEPEPKQTPTRRRSRSRTRTHTRTQTRSRGRSRRRR